MSVRSPLILLRRLKPANVKQGILIVKALCFRNKGLFSFLETSCILQAMDKNVVKAKVKIQVVLIDDETDFLEDTEEGLHFYKDSEHRFEVLGTAQSAETGIPLVQKLRPDIVIMDIKMPPGMDGITAANILRQKAPDTHVMIFSSHKDFSDIETIVNAGVRGYISKGSIKDLIKGIISVCEGEPYFPPEIVTSLFKKQFSKKEPASATALAIQKNISPRELEIITLHRQGLNKQEISEHLKISLSSVKTYFQRIQKKNGF